MDERKPADLPHREGEAKDEIDREAAKSRKKMDDIPPPGTNPMHEGP